MSCKKNCQSNSKIHIDAQTYSQVNVIIMAIIDNNSKFFSDYKTFMIIFLHYSRPSCQTFPNLDLTFISSLLKFKIYLLIVEISNPIPQMYRLGLTRPRYRQISKIIQKNPTTNN